MPNPVLAFVEKKFGPDFVPRLTQNARGLAEDFWKDPACDYPTINLKMGKRSITIKNWLKPILKQSDVPAAAPKAMKADVQRWHALPGEIAEKMWGDGYILPAGEALAEVLTRPLALTNKMDLLDLAAGLGGASRKLASQVNNIKALEPDPATAVRGNDLAAKAGKTRAPAVTAYDPADFLPPGTYDCVIARELFYRATDKPKFFAAIAASLKPHGQLAFTDYIVNPEDRTRPSIVSWRAQEKGAAPLGLIDMAELWAKAGITIRVSEDQTDFYRREVLTGLSRLVGVLAKGQKPDAETKKAILREVESWIHRIGAIEQGMKFYRFQAIKL